MSTFTGTLPTVAGGGKILAADITTMLSALHALADPWTDFSASVGWTSSGTAPAIGNGSIQASYLQVGKFVTYQGKITMGGTTTYGSANPWQVSLPVAAAASAVVGSAIVFDSSNTPGKLPATFAFGPTAANFFAAAISGGTGGPVSQTVPFTWASGDILAWTVTYQAA